MTRPLACLASLARVKVLSNLETLQGAKKTTRITYLNFKFYRLSKWGLGTIQVTLIQEFSLHKH